MRSLLILFFSLKLVGAGPRCFVAPSPVGRMPSVRMAEKPTVVSTVTTELVNLEE